MVRTRGKTPLEVDGVLNIDFDEFEDQLSDDTEEVEDEVEDQDGDEADRKLATDS